MATEVAQASPEVLKRTDELMTKGDVEKLAN
jgi:hypothetical protein